MPRTTAAPDPRSPTELHRLADSPGSATPELDFLLDVTHAARTRPQPEVLTTTCRGLARLFDVRVSAFVPTRAGDHLKLAVTRGSAGVDAPAAPSDCAHLLNDVVGSRHPVLRLVPGQRDRETVPAPALGVPLGSGGVLLLDGPNVARLDPGQQRVVVEVGAMLGRLLDEARTARANARELETVTAVRQLLEAGVHAVSRMEAAEVVARTTAAVLGVGTVCTYLVDEDGRIAEIATYGADRLRDRRLREFLLGAPADGSPVWRRAATGEQPGPDLIRDTRRPGAVRPNGVAELLGLRSMATIPLLCGDGPIGLVLCGDTGAPREWRAHDRVLLEQLALQGAVVVDNARLRELERHEARNDALTGLANRRAFHDELALALRHAKGTEQQVAVLQIDLDRFKEVNDQFGHHQGDQLLLTVAARLRAVVSREHLVARLGGDEFAVLMTGACADEAEQTADRIGLVLEEPVDLVDHEVTVEASIGVAVYPLHATDAELLQQRADRAMYAAKRSGLGRVTYHADQEATAVVDPGLLGELRRAIAEDELVLHYQPKIDLRTGRVVGAEALVRWQHPRLGLLFPDRFVPLAEQTGRIRSLTGWVLPHALAQIRRWADSGLDLSMAVNVSARDVADPEFPAKVEAWLAEAGVAGDRLMIELTESTLMADRATASLVLAGLRATGVRVSIDDFGTGYSSLAYLHSLPVDEIKIDRSFLGKGDRRYTVVRAILALGAGLGLQTVTEGVEDAATASLLTALGCGLAQGYYFARPLTPEMFAQRIRSSAGQRAPVKGPADQPARLTSSAARSPERTAPSM